MTERVRGPNRWDALNMAGMIIDAISTQRNFQTNEIEFKNQETLSLWTGLISRIVECQNSYTETVLFRYFPYFGASMKKKTGKNNYHGIFVRCKRAYLAAE